MTIAYLDTSAAMKLLVEEPESEALLLELTGSDRRLAASWLLHTELHCAAGRNPTIIAIEAVTTVLDAIDLVDVTRGDLLAAGTHAPLRSNDAIHLATALRLGVDEIVTYDLELSRAAAAAGVRVTAPA
ncbi:type II toxin-antitoxin system VapC family toxin [Salinibacterium sp. G-O1]|uniref:type II toxin-antitoxin system VapC family toxin n=1 Tax=Salinibacterium sp. G-O1 TaxID=3046208 RepID=UPI0024BAA07E|nr:type II toxin-antitoxin system VapC family toxin [Salinibacterium sp. G-O1]MDJ0333794.1 type II toxin-antitoxin system VapC family toxin [Salinibacterium sp. G-O1]